MPLVEEHGKLVRAAGHQVALRSVLEFTPFYVSVSDVDAHSSGMTTGSGDLLNNVFHYSAYFQSPYALKNVFTLFDLTLQEAGHSYLLWHVGDLEPYKSKRVELHLPVHGEIGSGNYYTHVFVDGKEVFNSTMDAAYIEASLDRMVKLRTFDIQQAKATPLVGPFPPTPAKFHGTSGQAVIRCTISTTGKVLDPEVKSATDPALGEAALVAARQWRFLPKIVNGNPVATKVSIPFDFPAK